MEKISLSFISIKRNLGLISAQNSAIQNIARIFNNYKLTKYSLVALLFCILYLPNTAQAQWGDLPVTGYNADVVADGANGAGVNSTTADVDGVNFLFVSSTFNPGPGICATGATALPTNNQIASLRTVGLTYTLQPYNANNSFRIAGTGTGTLTLVTPRTASNIYFLALGGSGVCTITGTVNFSDLTSQPLSTSAPDWCGGPAGERASGIYYRINKNSTTCDGTTCQYFYEPTFAINPENYGKTITSITINNTGNVLNIMGVGYKTVCGTPTAQPTALVAGTTTTSSIDASFTAASPAPTGTGGYLVVRYPFGSAVTNPVNGTVYAANQTLGLGTVVSSGATTTFSAAGLSGSSNYSFYVYTYNSAADCGGPIYLTSSPLTSNISTLACSGTMTGTIPIGPGLPNTIAGGFTSLTAAISAMGSAGLAGNTVFELQTGYNGTSTNETFPINFQTNPCVGASRTLTIRPASSVTDTLKIIGTNAGATINMNGISYVTFDGRPGGSGTSKFISISNTSASGAAIQFINDARNITFTYCDIQGQNTSSTSSALSGVVYFSTANATVLNGNDNNTLSFCNIHGTTGGTPAIGICSYGSVTSTSSWNDNNTITDCNIYDFFSATLPTTGIKLENGSNAFTISNNRFYQSVTRNYTTAAAHRILWLTPVTTNASSPCAFQVLNNYIGGDNVTGTGMYKLTGTGVYFWGMDINHYGTTPSSVQGNTITNISVASTITGTTNDFFRGISTGSTGNVNIGTITGNTIGSGTIDRAIILSTTGTGTNAYGIKNGSTSASTDTINIYNNIIGGITDSTTTVTNGANLYGIGVATGSYSNIVNNTIGSVSVPNSMIVPNAATVAQTLTGINVVAGVNTKITGNTIVNLTNGFVGTTTGLTRGISMSSSTLSAITGNTVYNIKSATTGAGTTTSSGLIGIMAASANPMTVTGNTVHSLSLTNATSTAATLVYGLYISANGTTPVNVVGKNNIHSFDVVSPTNTNAILMGIENVGGANILSNNMIRLGVRPDGTDLSNALTIRGIYLNTATATNIYHNSVYIGGSNIGSTAKPTMAFHRNATGVHDIRNNIFVNNRSNATLGAGGKHYQVYLNTTTTATLNNNVYYGTGNDAKFATPNNGTNDSTQYSLNWASTGDFGSSIGDPQYINPTGTASTVDLHIHATNPSAAESAGILIASVTDDIDGNIRATSTPTDIGADAGNFNGVNMFVDSTVVDQIATAARIGSINQAVIGIRIYTKNGGSPLVLSNFGLNTSGTTSVADISDAKVFYTGISNVFDTTTLYGTLPVVPSGAFSITGNRTLTPGLNYFWLSYNVKGTATANNTIDARLDALTLTGGAGANILNGGDPFGSRTIKAPLNTNYAVGSGQTYATITAALSDLRLLGVSAPVTFTLKDVLYNVASGEVFPLKLDSFGGASATNTVTIVPDGVLPSCRIESNNATATIDINGGKYFIIDGRPGASGGFSSGVNLQIVNSGTAAPAVRFINEAYKNTIQYTDLKGSNTVATATAGAGVVNFGITSGANGNDSNQIKFCDIHQEASSLPLVGISSIGSTTTAATNNDGNSIDNCNIYDFFSPTISSAGIYIGTGSGGWKITNNRVYQTAARTVTSTPAHRAFWITPNTATGTITTASGFDISNNYIGGDNAGGSNTYTMTGAVAYQYYAMDIQVGIGAVTSIQNNTVTNMSITNANASFYGFNLNNGNINFGTIAGNIFGSTSVNGAVTYTTSTSGGSVLPFRTGGGTTMTLKNNIVSGVNVGGSSASIAASFFGMNLSGGTTVVADNNTIGSTTLPNSITMANNTTTTGSVLVGIITNPGAVTSHSVINNTVSNFTNNYSGASTAPSIRAIHVAPTGAGAFLVDNNTVMNLTNASTSVGVTANASTVGIIVGTTAATSVAVTNNKVHSLTLTGTSTTAAVQLTGIYYAGPTAAGSQIGRNLVHSFSLTALNPAVIINGIEIGSGNVITANNMIRLGIDSTGASVTNANTFRGIVKGSGNSGIYFNTVYVGGGGVGADLNRTYAFQRITTGVDTVKNNIFENQRMNGGIGVGHFAVGLNNSTTLDMNVNILRSDSIGVFGGVGQQTLINWKGVSGVDANSTSGIAGLINPTGDETSLNLHVSGTTPIESAGAPVNGVGTDVDFDGQVRNTLTPIDIGADAGNFTPIDLAPPVISYTALANTTSTTNRTITATITDVTGVYFAGTLRPRIYYKKMAAGTYVSSQGVLVSGTKTNSTWDFTINSGSMSIAGGDSVYYYIIAQDSTPANNIGSLPGGVSANDVNVINTHPIAPFSYRVIPFITGTFTVGTSVPSTYPTLTFAINEMKNSVFNGPVVLELVDPLYTAATETFPIVISSAPGMSSVNTLTIRPAAGVTAIIRDSITHAILDLNGISNLILDGRQAGTGTPNSLSIVNRSVSNVAYGAGATPANIPNAIRFINDAAYNKLQYLNIQGACGSNESGVIFFSVGQVIGNSYNVIDQCNIGDVPGVANPFTIFCGVGSVDVIGKFNRNNTISNNNIYNFFAPAGESNGFKVSKGNTAWTIKGNHFYQTNPLVGTSGTQYLMNLNRRVGPAVSDDAIAGISLDSMVIIDNIFGGSGPNASGNPWSITGAGPNFFGVYGEYGKNSVMRISRNTFTNFEMNQNTTGNRWVAINVYNGLANVDSNIIGTVNGTGPITMTSTVNGTGILGIATNYNATTTPAGTTRISYNKMGGIIVNGNATTSVNFTGISIGNTGGNNTQTYRIEKNTIGNELANNIITNGASTSATVQAMIGISNNTNPANMIVKDNIIQNMTNTYAGTANALVHGINITVGLDSITGNYISNLNNAAAQTSAATSNTVSVVGIQSNSTVAGLYIAGNTVRNLWNTSATATNTGVIGINAVGVGSAGITGNTIYGLGVSSTSTGAFVYGESFNSANNLKVNNNMIALGLDTTGAAMVNTPVMAGINKYNTGSVAAFHNSILIQGGGVGNGVANTAAYNRVDQGTDSLINNILINTRENASTGGGHYAVNLNTVSGFTSHHNFFHVGSSSLGDTLIGLSGGLGYQTLPAWNTFSSLETGSKDSIVVFVSNVNLHLAPSMYGVRTFTGAVVSGVTTDIDGQLRATATPYMGADEIPGNPLPVELFSFNAVSNNVDVSLLWTTASEVNNLGFEVQRSVDGKHFDVVDFVKGQGNSSVPVSYTLSDKGAFETAKADVLYYRLKQLDRDGRADFSNTVSVSRTESKAKVLMVSPNPFNSHVTVSVDASHNEVGSIQVMDIQGKVVASYPVTLLNGLNSITIDGMSEINSGVYFVKLTTTSETFVTKVVKQ